MYNYNEDKKLNSFAPLGTAGDFGRTDNGGKGSGNFGHAGRPGEIGGSAPAGSTSFREGEISTVEEALQRLDDVQFEIKIAEELGENTSELELLEQEIMEQLEELRTFESREKQERDYDRRMGFNSVDNIIENGGKGSGNFGHAGREGKVGGSAPSGSGNIKVHPISGEGELGYYAEDGDKILASGKTEEEALEKAQKHQGNEKEELVAKIEKEYKDYGKGFDEKAEKVSEYIDNDDPYTGSRADAIGFLKSNIHYNRDTMNDDEFMEMTEDLIDDLQDVIAMSPDSKIRITPSPMSGSGLVFEEIKQKK